MSFLRRKSKASSSSSSSPRKARQLRRTNSNLSSTSSRISRISLSDGDDFSLSSTSMPLTALSEVRPWHQTVSKKQLAKMSALEKKRQQVLYELISTELAYLRDLVVIKNLFRKSVIDDSCCSEADIDTLFSNLDDVISVNGELYEALKSRRKDGIVSHVGDVFITMLKDSKFDVYIRFCSAQSGAIERYEVLNEHNAAFCETMRRCEQRVEESGGFNLPAFLLKGMQRLLKYQPLLQQLQKATPVEDVEYRQLAKAHELMNKVAFKVNEKVRQSELNRRLPLLTELVVPDMLRPWIGRPKFDTNFTKDPKRKLLQEGALKLVRSVLAEDRKFAEVYLILLSDMLLITIEKDGKYHMKDTKEYPSVIKIAHVTDIQTELTPQTRERTTFHIEVRAPSRLTQAAPTSLSQLIKDSPRPVVRDPERKRFRFETGNATELKSWVVNLLRARDSMAQKLREYGQSPRTSYALPDDEFAITLLVSTRLQAGSEIDGGGGGDEEESVKRQLEETMPDWEITFEDADDASGTLMVETTRHVRVVQGPDGLGMTLIGCNPVTIQEVDPDGSAYASGLRVGDAIRAVDGHECTGMSHEEVVQLIRSCLLDQNGGWNPVSAPLYPVPDALEAEAEIEEAAKTRGPHKTKKMTFLMDI